MDYPERVVARAMESGLDADLAAEVASLPYAVGKLLTCPWPDCGRILDARRAVIVEAKSQAKPGKKAPRSLLCASCFDMLKDKLGPVAVGKVLAVVVDGRDFPVILR